MSLGGGGSSGGGGGGSSESHSEASYPPEFRPLATSAVKEIQKVQAKLPLEQFTGYQPAGVAGLSPLQQYTMQALLPGTLNSPYGMPGLLDLPGSVGPAALGVMSAGRPTQGSQAALSTLSPRLGSTPQAQGMDPFWQVVASMVPQSGGGSSSAAPATSAFPGLTPSMTGAPAVPSSMTVPVIGGPSVDVSTGSILAPTASAPPAAAPPPPVAAVASGVQNKMAAQLTAQEMIYINRDFWGAVKAFTDAGYSYQQATSLAGGMWSAAAAGGGLPNDLPAGYTAVNPGGGNIPGYSETGYPVAPSTWQPDPAMQVGF